MIKFVDLYEMEQTRILITLLFLSTSFISLSGQKQKLDITGKVVDSLNKPLINATIVVVKKQDSIMLNYGLTNQEGKFKILNLDTGYLEVQVNYLGFQQKKIPLYQTGLDKEKDLGRIQLEKQSELLDEIEVTASFIPVQMKDDTIEYNAAAFKVEENAVVEGLLKKLPGVEIDKEGNIKLNGEVINQILVDGEEFFGSNPKLATQNLPADAIAKIQVFDKKSEMAAFSGVDDGNEQKAINLKLKEDRKKGFFGKMAAGYGSRERYSTNFNLNRFSKGEKLSFIVRLNNINQSGNGPGGFNMGGVSDGVNTAGNGGMNYQKTISKAVKFRGNYSFNQSKSESDRESTVQNFLTDPFLEDRLDSNKSRNGRHRMNMQLDVKMDTAHNIRFRLDGDIGERESSSASDNRISNLENELLSSSNNVNGTKSNSAGWGADLLYRRKFTKPGRTFSASVDLSGSENESTRRTISLNEFYLNVQNQDDLDSIWQYQLNGDDQFGLNIRSTFSESISKKQFLSITYAHRNTQNNNFRSVFELLSPVELLLGNELTELSNAYDRKYRYDQGKLTYRLNLEKIRFSTSLSAQKSKLIGRITSDGSIIEKSFVNFLPEGSLRWQFHQSKSLKLNYSTSVREPSLRQLQPFVDNSNPLRVYAGNPDLRPSYRHRLNLSYNSFQAFSKTHLFARINGVMTNNPIVNSKTIDSLFAQYSTPVNVDQSMNLYGNITWGKTFQSTNMRMNIGPNGSWSKSPVFVNGVQDTRYNLSTGVRITFQKSGEGNLDYGIRWSLNNTESTYEIDKLSKRSYANQSWNGNIGLKFLNKWRFESTMNYSIYGGDAFDEQQKIAIWNAHLSTKLLPNDRLELKVTLFDILNQNQGVNRSSDLNSITEERVNALSRYFMATATWSLTKMGR